MPQASRSGARVSNVEKDAATRAQEQEFKRARGAISCAECRRLKLKCDKTVPCGSCKRRGCESICPNGSLTTGQGTRFILADTDRLHKKIAEMSERIRQLEDAVAILQSGSTREVHPLLRPDLLGIKSGLELHSAVNPRTGAPRTEEDDEEDSQQIDVPGTLAVRDDGAATFYGRSAGSESLLLNLKANAPAERAESPLGLDTLHPYIESLANAFPAAPLAGFEDPATFQGLVTERLPEWARARQLCDLYLEQAPWFFGAITRRQLLEELLPLFYGEALDLQYADKSVSPSSSQDSDGSPAPAPTLPVSKSAFTRSSTGKATAHELALLFVVFCFGSLTDPNSYPAPDNKEAAQYYQLTRAAMNLEPALDRPASVATVQTLSLMGIYQGLVADENSIERTWALMGLSCKLAQSVGLHKDCARWKLTPGEVQKRRALFWELFITDCWQALATGRVPSFSLSYVDTELPADPDQTLAEDGTSQPSFPFWKATWGKEVVAAVVELVLMSRAPKYALILELDRKIRDIKLPAYTQGDAPKGASLSETMKHFMPHNYLHFTLLYVHRCYFAQALNDHPKDPLRSQYAPSFLAGYRSACTLLSSLREQFSINPVQIARFWVLWTHAFSSVIMLGSVATHGGTTKMAQAALSELRLAVSLFDQAAKYGGRAVKFLPLVRKLHEKAHQAFRDDYQRPDIFTPRDPQKDENDELSIFSGRTRTVNTKAAIKSAPPVLRRQASRQMSSSVNSPTTTEGSSSSSGSMRASHSPIAGSPQSQDSLPALATYGNVVHPMLVDDMRSFEGRLDEQINDAEQRYYLAAVSSASPDSRSSTSAYEHSPVEGYSRYADVPDESQDPRWKWGQQEMPPPPVPVDARYQQPIYEQHHPHQPSPVNTYYHLPPSTDMRENPYAMHGYDAPHSAPSMQPAEQSGYMAQAVPPVTPSYVLPPQPTPQEYWHHSSATPTAEYPAHGGLLPDPASATHYQHPQAHGRHPRMHAQPAPAYTPQVAPQVHGVQQMAPPTLSSSSSMLPVHSGTYSLTETWQSFMQHEMPAPPMRGYQQHR